jgi:hypothetical protein
METLYTFPMTASVWRAPIRFDPLQLTGDEAQAAEVSIVQARVEAEAAQHLPRQLIPPKDSIESSARSLPVSEHPCRRDRDMRLPFARQLFVHLNHCTV